MNFQIQPPKLYLIIYFQNNEILLFANDKKTVHFSPSTKCRFAIRNTKYFKNCKKIINYLKKYFILLSRRKRGKTHVKCSEKPSADRFADGKNSRRFSSIFPRFRIEIRSSRLLSTRYTLKKSVINERTIPLDTRLSLSKGWKTVSGGSPDNFWENASAVKMASFLLSFSSKS